jgi:type 1 glutamine amidotransferase
MAGRLRLIFVTLCVIGCGSSTTTAPASLPAQPSPSTSARVLLVTYTTGYRHSSIDVAEPVLEGLGRSSGLFTTTFCRTANDVNRFITASGLSGFEAVVFANTTGDLGIADLGGFLQWVAAGHAFAGMHAASDTYHDSPAYLDMLGNEFDKHGNQTEIVATVEAPANPAVAHLGASYTVFDEIYRFKANNRERVTPLLTLRTYPQDGLEHAGEPGDLPLAWAKTYGSGRVFYTALGHRDEIWRDVTYQQHVLGGIRWALGR